MSLNLVRVAILRDSLMRLWPIYTVATATDVCSGHVDVGSKYRLVTRDLWYDFASMGCHASYGYTLSWAGGRGRADAAVCTG